MIRTIGGIKCFVAVISHGRSENMFNMHRTIGSFTTFVNKGELSVYKESMLGINDMVFTPVVECGSDICTARNKAVELAGDLPCIQVSDDLRRIKRVLLANGKRTVIEADFKGAAGNLMAEMRLKKFVYGGVAINNNPLNFNGDIFSYNNFVPADLICVWKCPFKFEIPLKEDYDMSIKNILYLGGLVRCNNFLCDFPHRDNKGGANSYRDERTEAYATDRLKAKWSYLVQDHPTRQGQVKLNYPALKKHRIDLIDKYGKEMQHKQLFK